MVHMYLYKILLQCVVSHHLISMSTFKLVPKLLTLDPKRSLPFYAHNYCSFLKICSGIFLLSLMLCFALDRNLYKHSVIPLHSMASYCDFCSMYSLIQELSFRSVQST